MLRRVALLAFLLVPLGLLFVQRARGDREVVPVTPTAAVRVVVSPSPTARPHPPTPTPTPGYPLGTRTGEAAVDAFLDVIEAGDATAIAALVRTSATPCLAPGEFGYEPRCPAGVEPHTLFEYFPTGSCEPQMWLDLVAARERASMLREPGALYAVQATETYSVWFASGTHARLNLDGTLIGLFGCGLPTADLNVGRDSRWVLRPFGS